MHQVTTEVLSARTELASVPAPANYSVSAPPSTVDLHSVETSDGTSINLTQALFRDAAAFVYLETVGGTQFRAGPDGNITMIESAADPRGNRDVSRTRAWVYSDCDTWTIGECPRLTPQDDASPIVAFAVVPDTTPAGSNYLATHFEARLAELGASLGHGIA